MYRHTQELASGVSGIAAKSYHTNAAYDVDPALGSTETYGFDEYAAFYSYYRVIDYEYEITVINYDARSIMAYVVNSNIDASLAGTNYYLYSTQPYCESQLISNNSPNKHTFRGKVPLSKLLGSMAVETDDSFRALTSGIPTDLTWLTLAVEAVGGATVSAAYDFKIIMHIRFYGRELDLTLSSLVHKLTAKLALQERYKLEKEIKCKLKSPSST